MSAGETAFSGDSFQRDSSPLLGATGLYKPWVVSREFPGECTLLTGAEVLGTVGLHEKEFQMLNRHVGMRREEV